MSECSSDFEVLEEKSKIKSETKSSNGEEDKDQNYPSIHDLQNDIDINLSMKSNEEETYYIDDDSILESIKLPPNANILNFGNENKNKKQQSMQEREIQKEKERELEVTIQENRAKQTEMEKDKQRKTEKEEHKQKEQQKQTEISSSESPQSPESDSEDTEEYIETQQEKSKNMISKENSFDEIIESPKATKQSSPFKETNIKGLEDQSIVDISRSMYGEHLNKNESKAKSEQKNKIENSPLKSDKHQEDLNQINAFQSIHMQQIHDSMIKPTNTSKDVYFDIFVDNADHQNNMLLWKHDKDKISLRITSETYMEVVEHFLRVQIMLPLISSEQFKSSYINSFMKKYTKFLNDFYQVQFKEVLKKVKESHEQASNKPFPSTASTPKASQTTAGFIKSLLPFLKSENYSKPQITNNYLKNKINILNMIIQEKKEKLHNTDAEELTLKKIEEQICMLEMLISFENSENYCKKNSSDGGLDSKVWKEHGKSLNILFKEYLKSLEKTNEVNIQI